MTPSENIRYYIDIEGKTPAEAAQLARAEQAKLDGKKSASKALDNDATEAANRFARIAKRRK